MRQIINTGFLLWFIGLTLLVGPVEAQSNQPIGGDSLKKLLLLSKPDTSQIIQLVALSHKYVIKPGESVPDLDTALLLSEQAYKHSRSLGYVRGQGLSYLVAAQANREKGNRHLGMRLNQQAGNLLMKVGTPEDQADTFIEKAAYYSVSSEDLIQQVCLYERAVALLQRSGNKLKLADALMYRGDLYQLQSNNTKALKDLLQALSLYRSTGYDHLQEIYDLLGFVFSKMGDYEEGIKYGLLAMQTVEAARDTVKLAKVYSRLGKTYHELNQPDKALIYYNKSLHSAQTQHRRSTIIALATTISAILDNFTGETVKDLRIEEALAYLKEIIKRRPADKDDIDCRMAIATCYVNYYSKFTHEYAKAQHYCGQLEAMLQTNLGQDYHLYMYRTLIPFYISNKQYEKARLTLNVNEKLCQQAHYTKELAINHLWWFKLDSAEVNYASAIRHYQRYNTLTDSLINETTKQRTALFEVQYETQEKEKKIVGLRQESRLQEMKIQKAESTRNFIITGAIMLSLLLGLSYNRYRLKQRSNRQLQERQEEINLKNTTLQLLLTEKEWLLKEIHHRVKNNLQVVMSLLNSQASYLSDLTALSAIQESQHRVQAMALIHQKLYQSEQVARIAMPAYIQEMVAYLRDSYDLPQPIHFVLDVEPIELDVTQAVPLGLIINEAVTNTLKYAFPDGRSGRVSLSLRQLKQSVHELIIVDDGVGLPAGYNPMNSNSLGMTLMRGFSEQLGGELQVSSNPGLTITLAFGDEHLNPTSTGTNYAY
ncbi:tetratricopeptide repeat-containing sensor histidine kinase [Spirosoma spitsbergense]|uniref:tetratricopeptide repeat-containing sensor histidine kinase n=1 Tax=Spirosoma spitsbergense TaxID=431554 RepID=UPI0003811887|nr:histidine kinase dimerization/phosphoacceptor domain -containing protein [Spirosoma spitsbergense]